MLEATSQATDSSAKCDFACRQIKNVLICYRHYTFSIRNQNDNHFGYLNILNNYLNFDEYNYGILFNSTLYMYI